MLKKIKKRGLIAVLIFLGLFSAFSALAISFTNDVKLDLTGLTSEVYVNGDLTGSQSDSLTVSGANLTVSGIPNGNPFTLEENGAPDRIILRLTPNGGTADFSFSSANFSNGYINQWTTTTGVPVNYVVDVPLANTNYTIKLNGAAIPGNPFNSGASSQISFSSSGSGNFLVYIPCVVHDIWGYAYSKNIDWISFSCKNCDADDNGYVDVGTCGGDNSTTLAYDYGVDIDGPTEGNTGNLSGYAWSENIGWISFNASEFGVCPVGTCQPNVSLTTGALTGWARALAPVGRPLSETGGWDGWIKLNGTGQDANPYSPTLVSGNPSEFQGWAWGGDDNNNEAVIGFISFNSTTGGGPNKYAVYTDLSVNNAPTAVISCTPASCTIYHTEVLVLNNNSSDPDGVAPLGNITQSQWEISKPPAGYIVRPACVVAPILCDITPQNFPPVGLGLAGIGSYIARLTVTDAGGLSSTATRYFSILRDISAGFMCSLGEFGPWEDCDSMTTAPLDGQIVWFFDDPSLAEYSQASQGASIVSRTWRKNGVAFSVGNIVKTSIAASLPSMDIMLTVVDNAVSGARSASITNTIGASILPLPIWNEIAPF